MTNNRESATIKNTLLDAVTQLHNAGLREHSQLDAEMLLAHALGQTRTFLRTWPERAPEPVHLTQFRTLLTRRCLGEPVAYLIGKRDFWDMTLTVSPHTLIPRPETETLVERALEKIPPNASWRIADLGTGSGAIALAIARERPHCQIVATDISAAALTVARNNAARLKISNVRFAEGRWCEPLANEHFEIIISNPPYIHADDPHLQQGDLRFEPLTALQSGPDGLADIRIICAEARQHLRSPGWLLLEHGYNQGTTVLAILHKQGYQQVQTEKDLAQNDRISLGTWV
ncbi:MAG: peptide chain release factor N(5)-glutamine methyltransferase [Gammaproteobacteria bacterium]|nr:peptide chain release factor N(5)-glutamine methyltransferase [Gammaproteobacteria bacterium]